MAMFNPAHPGELIKETIDALSEETGKALSIKEIANGLAIKPGTLSSVIKGKQSVTPEIAIKLRTAFKNTSSEFWLIVQDNYDLAKAHKNVDTRYQGILETSSSSIKS